MKKTLSISIAQTLFNIEEDAYAALDAYLSSVKAHFADNGDRDEILKDIEARIAERFSELTHKIITLGDVEKITADMGTVNQFDGEERAGEKTDSKSEHRKRLYRNTDDAVIAGVASGLGYYFGVDAVLIRVIFVILSFITGTGVLLYVILWFVVPEAKTASQKLEMRGDPVTLSTVSNIIKEKIDEVDLKGTKSGIKKIFMIPVKILRALAKVIQKVIFPAVRIIVASVFLIGGFAMALGLTIGAGFLLFSIPVSFIGFPALGIFHGPLFYTALVASYVAALIPSILIFFLGLRIVSKRRNLSRTAALSLLAIFFIGLVTAGISVSRLAFHTEETLRSDPAYMEETTAPLSLDHFSSLSASGGSRITYAAGDAYSVVVSGRHYDIEHTNIEVSDGVLAISPKPNAEFCIFCPHQPLSITVTAPFLDSIEVRDGVRMDGSLTSKDSLSLSARDGSHMEMSIDSTHLTATLADGASMTLTGKTATEEITVSDGSRFDGRDLKAESVVVSARDGAYAAVSAEKTLSVTAHDGSLILYNGNPAIQKDLHDGAFVKKI